MLKHKFSFIYFVLFATSVFAHEDPMLKLKSQGGAGLFFSCHYCHSLQENVHLTGPSLANIWNKKSGSVKGYELYSDALKKKNIVWNEENLTAYLENPQKFIPGTTMTFKGFAEAKSVQNLVQLLKVALGPDGYKHMTEKKILSVDIAKGQLPEDLSKPIPAQIVKKVELCKNVYTIGLENGETTKHWQLNIGFKVDSSKTGPPLGKPVMQNTGSMGDRFFIIAKTPKELSALIRSCK